MKIGIDISPVIYQTGVSWYTKNLVDTLLKIDKKDEFVLFGGSLRRLHELKTSFPKRSNCSLRLFPFPPLVADFFWNRLHSFPIESFVGNVKVFHSSDWAQPPARRAKLVTTIHDLVPILFPEDSHPRIVATHKRRLGWVKKEADKVIAVSQATKEDILTHLGIPEKRISVVYEAPAPQFKKQPQQKVRAVKRKYKISGEYLLAVGTDPRKNIKRVTQAFLKTRKNYKNLSLVVVGRRWARVGQVGGVKFLGHVPFSDLPPLYAGARATVYASLYEGFGLPILESMAVGTPVLTSNTSSMPEVAGDAAVLVNPNSTEEIAKGIKTVLGKRGELVKKGLARAKEFSWEKTAKETLKVYKEALKQ